MLKLYGWEERFSKKITDDYIQEYIESESMRIPNAIESIVNQMCNQLMPLAIFATYVYLGNTMSVSTTVLATMMINRIKGPI